MKQCPEDACQALSQVVELVERDAPKTTLESAALDLLSILAHTDCRVRTSSEARLRTGQLCDRLAQHLALLGSVQMACELTDWHAKLLQDTKQPKAALRLMTSWFKSIELKHGSPEILLRYASLLVAKKRYADAYPVACAAVENCRIMECTSILPIALHTYAVVLEGNRNFERAEDVYREAFEEAKNVDIKLAVKFKQSLRECKEANRVKNRSLGQRKKKMKKMKIPSKTESNTVKRKSSTKEPEGSILHAFCHQQQGQQDVLDAWMSETYQGYHRGQILNLTSSSQSGSEEDSSQPQRYFVIPDQLEQMSSEFSNCSTPDSNVLQSENTTLGPKHPQSSACNYLSSPFGFEEKEMKEVRNQAMNENIYCSNTGDQGKISISNSTKVLFKTATRPTAQSHYSVCCQKTILVPEHSHQPEQKENHIEVPLYRGAQERYEHERSPISPDVRNLMYSEQTFTTSSSPISSGLSSSSLSSSSTEPSSSSLSSSSTEPSSSSLSLRSTEPPSSSLSSTPTEPSSSSLSSSSTEPSSSSSSSSSTEPSSSSSSSSSTEPSSSSSSSSSTEPSSSSSSSSSTEPSSSSSSSSSIEPSSSSLSSSSTEPFNSSQSTRNYKDTSGPTSLASSSELSASSLNSRCISSSSPSPRFENSANILFATSSNHASSSSQHLIQADILSSSLSSSYDDVSSSSQSSSQLLPRTNKAVDFSSPCSKEGFCCCSCSYEEVETVAAEVKNTQRLPVIVRLNEHPVSSFQSVHSTPSLGSSSSRLSQGLRCDLSSEPCAKSTRPLERSQVTTKSQVPHLDFSKLSKSSPLLFAPKMCPPESHTVRSSSACSDLVEQSSIVGLLSNSYTNRSYKQASRAKIPRTKTLWPPGMKVKPLF